MKKFLVLLAMIGISTAGVYAGEQYPTAQENPQTFSKEQVKRPISKEAAFERRLGLTEVQKLKARQIRIQGQEKLKPVMEQIREKRQAAEAVRLSRISVQAQEEKLAEIDADLKVLEKQAQEIRKQNMKDFEAILTKQQKKTLKEMKNEGRKKYHEEHPYGHPPMSERN
jgi:Spy/CpxP family protein refolding chaperone